MQFSDYLSLIALAISILSTGYSLWFGLRDRAQIKTKSEFFPANIDEDGPFSPAGIRIRIANHGRRPIYLEYLYFQYGRSGIANYAETVWEGDKYGRCQLGEGDKYEHFFDPDSDAIFKSADGIRATDIFFRDSLGRNYYVKGARQSLEAYFAHTEPDHDRQ
jgi:hypothetical protein